MSIKLNHADQIILFHKFSVSSCPQVSGSLKASNTGSDLSTSVFLTIAPVVWGLDILFLQMESRLSPHSSSVILSAIISAVPSVRFGAKPALQLRGRLIVPDRPARVCRTRRSALRMERAVPSRQDCGPMVTEPRGTDWTCIPSHVLSS